jgi:hypothetical protein
VRREERGSWVLAVGWFAAETAIVPVSWTEFFWRSLWSHLPRCSCSHFLYRVFLDHGTLLGSGYSSPLALASPDLSLLSPPLSYHLLP